MGPKCLRPTCHDGTYRAETVIVEAPLPVAGDPPYPELDATKRFRTNHSPPSTGHDVRPGRTWPQLPGPVQSSVLATVRTTSDWLGNGEYVCALGEMRSVCWASGERYGTGNFTLAASCAVLCDCCYWRCTHPPDGPVPVLHPRLVARASCTAADTHGVEWFGWLPLSFGGDPTELQ
jgi:hypothetical protein